jgi:hypothetical protein
MLKVLMQKWNEYFPKDELKRMLIEDLKVVLAVSIAIACFLTFVLTVGCSGKNNSPNPRDFPRSDYPTAAAVTAKVPPLPSPAMGIFVSAVTRERRDDESRH